jgi:hypothetical protein
LISAADRQPALRCTGNMHAVFAMSQGVATYAEAPVMQ